MRCPRRQHIGVPDAAPELRRHEIQAEIPNFLIRVELVARRAAKLKLVFLPCDQLPESQDMIELPSAALLPAECASVLVRIQKLCFLLNN